MAERVKSRKAAKITAMGPMVTSIKIPKVRSTCESKTTIHTRRDTEGDYDTEEVVVYECVKRMPQEIALDHEHVLPWGILKQPHSDHDHGHDHSDDHGVERVALV